MYSTLKKPKSQVALCSSDVTVHSRTDRQQIPRLMYNPKAHYRQNSPPLAPILSQMNPIHSLSSCYSGIQFRKKDTDYQSQWMRR